VPPPNSSSDVSLEGDKIHPISPPAQHRRASGLSLPREKLLPFKIAPGWTLSATPVFDTYWHFAARRQELLMRRLNGEPAPWTDDPVLASYRFTNVYRAADRVSQYLIRHILYNGSQTSEEILFRTLLFKFFNRIETWEELTAKLGVLSWHTFEFERYASVLDAMLARGEKIYSAAYIMPSPSFGSARKHRNHLQLLEHIVRDGAPPTDCSRAVSTEGFRDSATLSVFRRLFGVPVQHRPELQRADRLL
jgi:hypothetical protein